MLSLPFPARWRRVLFLMVVLLLAAGVTLPARADSVQFQSTMTVRPGCSIMERSDERGESGYLCSPNVGDFRLTLDRGRYSDGTRRYLSDGEMRVPYRLQVFTGQGERLSADRVLSISLPENAPTLMLKAFNTPMATMPDAAERLVGDTVVATFEY